MTETPPRGSGAAAPKFMGHTLPAGTRIGSFEITGLIGEGGFGIVYLAYDASLQRQVALKEYMPSSLASRATESHDVAVKSDRYAETFNAGLKSFVNEARLLARFDHPSLVKVYQFFEANRTAYMAMPYYEGPTLKRALAEMSHAPDEATLREWLRPLLSALTAMHKEHCWHRDIAPDNILLTPSGPLLLDFGAARRVIGDMTHALTVVLKPGYAPIEQYGEAASMAQGPWTDLYALASVVHYAITGRPPTTSVERVMGDEMAPLSSQAQGRYSEPFLAAIDATLAVRPKDRPQDVAAFCELLNLGLEADHPARFRSSGFQSTGFDALAAPIARFEPVAPEASQPTVLLPHGARVEPIGPGAPKTPKPADGPAPSAQDEASAAPMPSAPRAFATPVIAPASKAPAASAAPASGMTRSLMLAGAGVLGVAALGFYFGTRPGSAPPGPVAIPAPAPRPAPAVARPAPLAAEPVLMPATPMPAVRPVQAEAGSTGESARPGAPPSAATTPRTAQEPKPPAPVKSDGKSRATAAAAAPRAEPPPKNAGVKPARCSDILQKASLEPISREEAEYLRKECR